MEAPNVRWEELSVYESCPRCGLFFRVHMKANGSPLCPDCRRRGENVRMERVDQIRPMGRT